MTTPTQTKPGAVTPGPTQGPCFAVIHADPQWRVAVNNPVSMRTICLTSQGNDEANARFIAEAFTVLHTTGKTPSELAAEVERLAKDRDALLAAAKIVEDGRNGCISSEWNALAAAIHQCEGAKA